MNFLKKQGVAWVITIVMILIGIGLGTPKSDTPQPEPLPTVAPTSAPITQDAYYFVQDDAGILSNSEEKELGKLNEKLADSMGVVVACVTTRDGRADIYKLALEYGDQLGLEEYDFIVVVDMSSMQYILVQGAGLVDLFTDSDCEKYADRYLADGLDRGDYGGAFMELAEALADWYEDHYVA